MAEKIDRTVLKDIINDLGKLSTQSATAAKEVARLQTAFNDLKSSRLGGGPTSPNINAPNLPGNFTGNLASMLSAMKGISTEARNLNIDMKGVNNAFEDLVRLLATAGNFSTDVGKLISPFRATGAYQRFGNRNVAGQYVEPSQSYKSGVYGPVKDYYSERIRKANQALYGNSPQQNNKGILEYIKSLQDLDAWQGKVSLSTLKMMNEFGNNSIAVFDKELSAITDKLTKLESVAAIIGKAKKDLSVASTKTQNALNIRDARFDPNDPSTFKYQTRFLNAQQRESQAQTRVDKLKFEYGDPRQIGAEIVALREKEKAVASLVDQVQRLNQAQAAKTTGGIADTKFLESLKLTAPALDELTRKLQKAGLMSGTVAKDVTELSNGIRTIQISDKGSDPSAPIKRFTFHLNEAGQVLTDTQRRFRTFADAVGRDITEVLKWSLATMVVYDSLRKIQEAFRLTVEFQSDLIDTQIILGKSTADLGSIFESAADIADQTSSTIAGVVDSYNEAYAAVGALKNPYERAAQAGALLTDAMALSKLSGMDQKQSLDTLVGALAQSNMEMYQGIDLLDKWVEVSKNANVSINALASTFAITGSAALEIGTTFEELNALTAVMSEVTKMSADEVGNAIRGFIAGFQSEKAEAALAQFGIAVRDTYGQVRSFTDLMSELAYKRQEGVLSEKQVAQLTNIIGGGFRRGAQLTALMNDWGRVMGIVEVQSGATGAASEALGLKMDSLESATTRLNNAFASFSETLFLEGGAIEGATTLTNILTGLLDIVKDFTGTLGGAASSLALFGAATVIGNTTGVQSKLARTIPGFLQKAISPTRAMMGAQGIEPIINSVLLNSAGLGLGGRFGLPQSRIVPSDSGVPEQMMFLQPTIADFLSSLNRGFGEWLFRPMQRLFNWFLSLAGRAGGTGITQAGGRLGAAGLVVPGLLIADQISDGKYRQAGATFAGAAIGALVTAGNPVGTAIGSIIASSFYDSMMVIDEDLGKSIAEAFVTYAREFTPGGDEPPADETLQEKLNRLNKELIDTTEENWDAIAANWMSGIYGVKSWVQTAVYNVAGRPESGILSPLKHSNVDIDPNLALMQLYQNQLAGNEALGSTLQPETMKLIAEILEVTKQIADNGGEGNIPAGPYQERVVQKTNEIADMSAEAAQEIMDDAISGIAQGAANSIESYKTGKDLAGSLASQAANLIVASEIANAVSPENPKIDPQEAVTLYSKVPTEQATQLNTVASQIRTAQEQLDLLGPNGDPVKIEEQKRALNEGISLLYSLEPAMLQGALVASAEMKLMPVIDLPDELPPEEVAKVLEAAEGYWDQVLDASDMTEPEKLAFKATYKEQLLRLKGELLAETSNTPQEFINMAMEKTQTGTDMSAWSFQDLRDQVSPEMLPALLGTYQRVKGAFETKVPGFVADEKPVSLILEDGFHNLSVDNKLFQLALEELIDIEREQVVEGMYNLPSNSTFYVPFRAAELDATSRASQAEQEMGDYWDQYPPSALTGSPTVAPSMEEAMAAMRAASQAATQATAQTMEEVATNLLQYPTDPMAYYNSLPFNYQQPVDTQLPYSATPAATSSELPSILTELSNLFKAIAISLGLNLNINSTTMLQVDGRVLADIVKQYLYTDTLQAEGSGTSLDKTVVV